MNVCQFICIKAIKRGGIMYKLKFLETVISVMLTIMKAVRVLGIEDYIIIVRLMVISFLQSKCHPVTRCIKKIADQPCYNVIFYMRRTEHKYKKNVCLCLPLTEKYCQIATFFDFKFRALVCITKKKIFF